MKQPMSDEAELEKASKLADAELGVAEELGWVLAALAAGIVHIKVDNWWVTVAAFGIAYWLVTLRYRKRSAAAEDAYYRAAKLGKYVDFNK